VRYRVVITAFASQVITGTTNEIKITPLEGE